MNETDATRRRGPRDRKPFVTIKFISNTLVNKYTIEVCLVGSVVCARASGCHIVW